MNKTIWYKQFNRRDHPLVPSKEEYEAYTLPCRTNRKKGTSKPKEIKEMTLKEITYHNYIHNYVIWYKE